MHYTGGEDGSGTVRQEIYRLDVKSWEEVSKMRQARASHAVSLIDYNLVEQFCTEESTESDDEGSGNCSD